MRLVDSSISVGLRRTQIVNDRRALPLRRLGMTGDPRRNPNPQGKGTVAVLADWQATRPREAARKSPEVLLLDWFVSALVLSARFSFRPAIGQRYWLYCREGQWQLSLVGPSEWGARRPGTCLGACELRGDMTWSLTREAGHAQDEDLQEHLVALVTGFMTSLDSDSALAEQLPGYRRELPYYQRLLATALGRSLREATGDTAHLAAPARWLLAAGTGLERRLLGDAQSRS